jgi:hypothetical protein
MKTMYIKAAHINAKIRELLRNNTEGLLQTGARLTAEKVGAVWHYKVTSFKTMGQDLVMYNWACLNTEPLRENNCGDTDGDYIVPLGYARNEGDTDGDHVSYENYFLGGFKN